MRTLQGVGVLVTRPEQQASPLCHLLESRGASVLRLPALEIRPIAERRELSARSNPPEPFDLVIFTSANAVRFGAPLLARRSGQAIAAIGPATARALEDAGLAVTIAPSNGFDSEHLLGEPGLKEAAGRRILIVKGRGGRELLQAELATRGAQVVVAEVYERVRAQPSVEDLAALEASFTANRIQVITATSVEIADGLLEMATPGLRREFERVHWLVASARVAAALRGRGMPVSILQADSAEDQDLVAAIERWRSSVSGA